MLIHCLCATTSTPPHSLPWHLHQPAHLNSFTEVSTAFSNLTASTAQVYQNPSQGLLPLSVPEKPGLLIGPQRPIWGVVLHFLYPPFWDSPMILPQDPESLPPSNSTFLCWKHFLWCFLLLVNSFRLCLLLLRDFLWLRKCTLPSTLSPPPSSCSRAWPSQHLSHHSPRIYL